MPRASRFAYLPHATIADYTAAAPFGRFRVAEVEIVTLRLDKPYPPLESYAVIPSAGKYRLAVRTIANTGHLITSCQDQAMACGVHPVGRKSEAFARTHLRCRRRAASRVCPGLLISIRANANIPSTRLAACFSDWEAG